ncbi:MAG: histidine kinase [Candidatus Competibacter sp.]|nr:histidine kinase [Candidatus Competibacter sp.]MDG4585277.1 histidine kinase [Candidatus Competibacter sp.]
MRQAPHRVSRTREPASGFLPDFCANPTVFLTILLAELFALVLALSEADRLGDFWNRLALISLFVQWVVLGAAAALCLSRRWLNRLGVSAATWAVFGLTQLVTLLFSALGWWFLAPGQEPTGFAAPPVGLIARNLAIGGIVTLLALRYFYVRHQWQRNVEAEARSRLRALQARIHPHFLFNTLNTIAGLIPARPEQAEQAVLDLADLLRSALAHQERITLGEELELTRRFIAIERLRLGERLQVEWRLADGLPLAVPLPALLLQPLVENAIRHGIQTLPEGGRLTIGIDLRSNTLRFTIANPRRVVAGGPAGGSGQRLAQDNIRQRLLLAFGAACQLEIVEAPDRYQVAFSVPLGGE